MQRPAGIAHQSDHDFTRQVASRGPDTNPPSLSTYDQRQGQGFALDPPKAGGLWKPFYVSNMRSRGSAPGGSLRCGFAPQRQRPGLAYPASGSDKHMVLEQRHTCRRSNHRAARLSRAPPAPRHPAGLARASVRRRCRRGLTALCLLKRCDHAARFQHPRCTFGKTQSRRHCTKKNRATALRGNPVRSFHDRARPIQVRGDVRYQAAVPPKGRAVRRPLPRPRDRRHGQPTRRGFAVRLPRRCGPR